MPVPKPGGQAIEPQIGARARTMFVIFGAFVMATFIYAALIVMGMMTGGGEAPEFPVPPWILLGALSLTSIAICFVTGAAMKPKEESGPVAYLNQVQQRMIVQAAACESIAIYGLVFQIFGLSRLIGLIACAASFVALIALLPGLRDSVETANRLERSDPAESLRRPMGGGG